MELSPEPEETILVHKPPMELVVKNYLQPIVSGAPVFRIATEEAAEATLVAEQVLRLDGEDLKAFSDAHQNYLKQQKHYLKILTGAHVGTLLLYLLLAKNFSRLIYFIPYVIFAILVSVAVTAVAILDRLNKKGLIEVEKFQHSILKSRYPSVDLDDRDSYIVVAEQED